ncbi:anhydro-N-acetylmuramic acid kinase [Granulosicoccaceae sp. 1_MG-2023]|nr:anhydro-N-acetylmuramic acid kinase [Granulosicoccaceae sp. 1_MG-2023]
MTGTSADGIDAALVRFEQDQPQTVASCFSPYPARLREQIISLSRRTQVGIDALFALDNAIADQHSEAVSQLLMKAGVSTTQVTAIGFHGQTLHHHPDGDSPFTVQSGNPARLAALTGIDVIADFRRADMAQGGQGAPFAPALHDTLLRTPGKTTVVLNLGGIANITVLRDGDDVIGFDTGPANALMDDWIGAQLGRSHDHNGQWAAGGRVNSALLNRMLADPYFSRGWPKSTGRETFNLHWLETQLAGLTEKPPAQDIQASLLELTAVTVADAISAAAPDCRQIITCGGGVHNLQLIKRLGAHLPGATIRRSDELGVDSDYLEAVLMAWLAQRFLQRLPGNLPSVTGARRAVICGALYPA